jgi:hypothetical protein
MLMSDSATFLAVAASTTTAFWDAFWPNLASTLVGAALGVPLGLLINRSTILFTERSARQAETKLLKRTLQALDSALECNHEILRVLLDKTQRNAQGLVMPLDTGTWDAVRSLLPTSFSDPVLLRRLAYYWVQLGQVTSMHHMILQRKLAENPQSPTPKLSAMEKACDEWFRKLQTESTDLRCRVRSHLEKPSPVGKT